MHQPRSLARTFAATATLVALACSDEAVPPSAPPPLPTPAQAQATSEATIEPDAVPRVDLSITATGSFRPNAPVRLSATAVAARDARSVSVEFLLVDGDGPLPGQGNADGTRALGASTRALQRGSSSPVLDRTVSSANRVTYVSDAQANGTGRYATCCDRIYLGPNRIWDDATGTQEGTFIIAHEFGHAFHHRGIEMWGSYSCHDDTHSIDVLNTYSCAFVEGFADFLSVWVLGDFMTSGGENGGQTTDYLVEQNPYRTSVVDGGAIEGAVAAFMYDLVDGTGEPDGSTNVANGDEAFDIVAFSGTELANVIRSCSLFSGVGYRRSVASTTLLPVPSAPSRPGPRCRWPSNQIG